MLNSIIEMARERELVVNACDCKKRGATADREHGGRKKAW